MSLNPVAILDVLDRAAADFTFPMLDNGYVYLSAIRLSLHRSDADWALVFERFGFSPRAGIPSLDVQTFASRLYRSDRDHDSFESVYPIDGGDWIDHDDGERVATGPRSLTLRGRARPVPTAADYTAHGVELVDPDHPRVFELCRCVAAMARAEVLATDAERRAHVPPELRQVLVLDDWHHPNAVAGDKPSASSTFQQLAAVLHTGDLALYHPSEPGNTHWRHWPDGGSL
jgi:hypothetical protein